MNEDLIVFGAGPLAFIGVSYLAYRLGNARNTTGLLGMAAVWGLFAVIMFSAMQRAINWDDYLAALVFVSLPTGVGALVGGSIGWLKESGK